jgi:hypothetical protein
VVSLAVDFGHCGLPLGSPQASGGSKGHE